MAEVDIAIYSLNCNGLGDKTKRMAVLNKLKRKGKGIFMLQETHSTIATQAEWFSSWDSKNIFFSHGTSNKKGVITIISKEYDIKILNEYKDTEGRYIILDIEMDNIKYTIGNLYAPTRNFEKEQINTFKDFISDIRKCEQENVILGGDFNLYLNPRVDKLHSMPDSSDNPDYRQEILSYLEVNDMIDIWRTLNPDKRMYTWFRGHDKRSRLDYIFTSEHLLNYAEKIDILPGIFSDHSLVKASFSNGNSEQRGRGFWKFNTSLLHDDIYVKEIKNIIKESRSKYQHLEDKGLLWELIKSDVRSFTVPYTAKKKKVSIAREEALNKRYNELHNVINSGTDTQNVVTEFYQVKEELELF
jgi:exonuclease III